MFLSLLKHKLSSTRSPLVRHTKIFSPSMKIGVDKFELSLNVESYNKDELVVKAHPKYVIIEGKQERETPQGYVIRQFVKKYRLPEGCKIKQMVSQLSPEGILTLSAPRSESDVEVCDIISIPVKIGAKKEGPVKKAPADQQEKELHDPCADYPKVKPK